MKKKFGALRIISGIFKVLAVLFLLGGIAATGLGIFALTRPGGGGFTATTIAPAVVPVIAGIIGMILLLAFSQIFDLLLSLEENTRLTAVLLQRQLRMQQQQDKDLF